MSNTDTRFFTNEGGSDLSKRLKAILPKNTKFFDVLVGYFRASGFLDVYKQIKDVEKIRILVGINAGKKTAEMIEGSKNLRNQHFSSKEARENYLSRAVKEINKTNDTKQTEEGLKTFINYIESGKLEVKVYKKTPIHAKMYIIRKDPKKVEDFGKVITGSSNFSYSGLSGNLEFNVELKDNNDVKFALKKFEKLWEGAVVDITDEYVSVIQNKTWFNEEITPFELYLKFLYEHFGEKRIDRDKNPLEGVPKKYLKLQYQLDAVEELIEKINKYDGAYLADVVGLGKTFTTAMVAKKMNKSMLVIAPPLLKDYWKNTLFSFGVPQYKIYSHGELEKVLREENLDNFECVVIDEAHKFRNEKTQRYAMLESITAGKKVILISATPLNNEPMDVGSQIFLFQDKYRSDIPGLKNLHKFFKNLQNNINKISRRENPNEYLKEVKKSAEKVRKRVLSELMVRRTRQEVEENYKKDLEKQGVSFPDIKPPNRVFYKFNKKENKVFEETINMIRDINYARYRPLTYLKPDKVDPTELTAQYNLRTFMRGLLVKRLDSSFFAFRQTLDRFIESYNQFIDMYEEGTVHISQDINIFELMEEDDNKDILEKIESAKEKGKKVRSFKSEDFKKGFKEDLIEDKKILESLKSEWEKIDSDPKLEAFLEKMEGNQILSNESNKVIIFTESKESAEYLGDNLKNKYGDKVKIIHGSSNKKDFTEVEENFNPNLKKKRQKDKIRIVVATDALSEGINLHRANIIINYDIPWNPTKVLQRVGRVNRVGSTHDKVYIFNFFPTDEIEGSIGLEQKAVAKLQAFHDALGEDAQYLTEDEEYSPQGLFDRVNSGEFVASDPKEGDSESPYLTEIRKIRDENFELYQKIKKLAPRSKTAKSYPDRKNQLLTYFKVGDIDKIYISDEDEEIIFKNAAQILKADKNTKRTDIVTKKYHKLKNLNKERFLKTLEEDKKRSKHARGNINTVLKQLETLYNNDLWTEKEKDYINDVITAVEVGISDETISNLKEGITKVKSPKDKLEAVKNNVDEYLVEQKVKKEKSRKERNKHRKVILSEFLTK